MTARRINIYVPEGDLSALRAAAEAAGETLSAYLVRAGLDLATAEAADLDPRAREWLRCELQRRLEGLL